MTIRFKNLNDYPLSNMGILNDSIAEYLFTIPCGGPHVFKIGTRKIAIGQNLINLDYNTSPIDNS